MSQELREVLRALMASPLARQAAREFAGIVREELHAANTDGDWIDQYRSPFRLPGQKASKRHCAIVRRRASEGKPGARISPDGKQFFLSRAAIEEETAVDPGPPRLAKAAAEHDADDDTGVYERALLERVGR